MRYSTCRCKICVLYYLIITLIIKIIDNDWKKKGEHIYFLPVIFKGKMPWQHFSKGRSVSLESNSQNESFWSFPYFTNQHATLINDNKHLNSKIKILNRSLLKEKFKSMTWISLCLFSGHKMIFYHMHRLLMLSSLVILIDKKQNFLSEQCETSTVELGILVFQWSL